MRNQAPAPAPRAAPPERSSGGSSTGTGGSFPERRLELKGPLHCDVVPPPEVDSGFCVRSTAPIVDHPGGELAFSLDGKLGREPLPAGILVELVPLAQPPSWVAASA